MWKLTIYERPDGGYLPVAHSNCQKLEEPYIWLINEVYFRTALASPSVLA